MAEGVHVRVSVAVIDDVGENEVLVGVKEGVNVAVSVQVAVKVGEFC